MKIDQSDTDRRITIRIGKFLDQNAYPAFARACRLAELPAVQSIVVDLGETTHIRASGLELLLMLRDRAGSKHTSVLLGNCHPRIREQICTSRLLAEFSRAAWPPAKGP